MWKWYDSTVIKIEQETPQTKRLWLALDNEEKLTFKAGQFITMDLPISDKRLKRWRSYSIANTAGEEGTSVLEFCVVRAANSTGGSEYLCDVAEVGTPIKFKGPDGTFCLKTPIDKDIVMVCTGTGIAPFRSMLKDIQDRQLPHRKLHLIFGTRTEADILYRQELTDLAAQNPLFTYDIVLSRDPNWPGHTGYVHQVYEAAYATVRPDVAFYLCGWSNMIDEAVATLTTKMGYDKSQVYYELYG